LKILGRRGVSPVIATILLIASTVAAAAIVAVYVSGIYVSRTAVVAGNADGTIYDSDNTANEMYKNENVLITFYTTYGYLREVGDLADGLVVTIGSATHGWGPFQASARGQTNYDAGHVEASGYWKDTIPGLSGNQGIRWKLYVPVTAAGRLSQGVNAYLYLWADKNVTTSTIQASGKVSPATKLLWDYYDDLTITVSCRADSFTTTWGTIRLFGQNWIAISY
jgi:flagellin-like protein